VKPATTPNATVYVIKQPAVGNHPARHTLHTSMKDAEDRLRVLRDVGVAASAWRYERKAWALRAEPL